MATVCNNIAKLKVELIQLNAGFNKEIPIEFTYISKDSIQISVKFNKVTFI